MNSQPLQDKMFYETKEKLARYHREAEVLRQVEHVSTRHRLAHTLREWAERLEPTTQPRPRPLNGTR